MQNVGGDMVRARESSRARRVMSAATLWMIAALVACGGNDGPTATTSSTLDVNAIATSANRMQAVVGQPVLLAVVSQASVTGVPTFDRGVARLPRLLPRAIGAAALLTSDPRMASAARLPAATALPRQTITGFSALIPDSLMGKTLVPDSQGNYSVSAGATGAPANGVRFIIRTLGTTQDLGYADLTQSTSGSTATLTADVKTTAGTLALHNVETTTLTGNDETDGFTGYVTNGTDRFDYAVTVQTVGARTIATTTVTAPSAGVAVADTTVIDGMTASDVDVARLTVGSSTLRFTTAAIPDGTGGYIDGDTTNISANGAPFARVVVDASGHASVTGPTGGSLSAADQQALYGVEIILAGAAYTMLVPLTVTFWLALATGGV